MEYDAALAQVDPRADAETGTLYLDLWYPSEEGNLHTIDINLMHTRATDSIRVRYDFERNGWSILQSWQEFVRKPDSMTIEVRLHWKEVSFHAAWSLERETTSDQIARMREEDRVEDEHDHTIP